MGFKKVSSRLLQAANLLDGDRTQADNQFGTYLSPGSNLNAVLTDSSSYGTSEVPGSLVPQNTAYDADNDYKSPGSIFGALGMRETNDSRWTPVQETAPDYNRETFSAGGVLESAADYAMQQSTSALRTTY